ncbi:MAG TPA: MBL fold metallo-hydrolase [Mycobacterium sp.]|nr:MBL fold metallo-hydrolase [Mycobacterium sp.]
MVRKSPEERGKLRHSLGHICLWSQTDRLLFSGDHLLPAVTPPVTFERGFDKDPLRSYLASLKLVAERDPMLARTPPCFRGRPAPSRRDHAQQTTPARRHSRHDPQPPVHRP